MTHTTVMQTVLYFVI